MPWFKVDDSFWSHPKLSELSHAAISLWVRAGAYCAQHLTDGRVTAATVTRQLWTGTEAADELAAAGLWDALDDGSGWQFHDWLEYQPTAAETEQKRAAARERVQRARAKKRATSDAGNADVRANSSVTSGERTAQQSRDSDVTEGARSQDVRSTPNPNPNPMTTDVVIDPPTPRRGEQAKGKGKSRGTRLDADWRPDADTVAKIAAELPGLDYQREHAVFVDYWLAQPGQRGVKVDWAATWRNWMRRAAERGSSGQSASQRPTPMQRAQQTMQLATALDMGELS